MKTSEAFRLTKKHLLRGPTRKLRGSEQFICCAADHVKVGGIVRPIIENLMNPRGSRHSSITLECWLRREHNIDTTATADVRKIQQTRHAWLDHLIAHYKSLGD